MPSVVLLTRNLLILGLLTNLLVPPEEMELLHRTCMDLFIRALKALVKLL